MCRERCSFAGEVTGIELGDRGLEVVEVEHDGRRDTAVEVDLGEDERLGEEPLLLVVKGDARTSEGEAVPAGR